MVQDEEGNAKNIKKDFLAIARSLQGCVDNDCDTCEDRNECLKYVRTVLSMLIEYVMGLDDAFIDRIIEETKKDDNNGKANFYS